MSRPTPVREVPGSSADAEGSELDLIDPDDAVAELDEADKIGRAHV